MPIDFEVAQQFLRDIMDKVMLVAGAFFLVMAVAFFSPAYQLYSMGFLLLGVLLVVVGLVLHFESFSLKIPSLEGWGTISICASAMLMALAVGFALYAVPGGTILLPVFTAESAMYGSPPPVYRTLVILTRPNQWLAPFLAYGAIALLIFGVFSKSFRDIF